MTNDALLVVDVQNGFINDNTQIGRASCRERV